MYIQKHWDAQLCTMFKASSIFVSKRSAHVKFRKRFRGGDHGTYLAKAAFAQHLVEHQLIQGEVYPGNYRGRWGRVHALTCVSIGRCFTQNKYICKLECKDVCRLIQQLIKI